jgi:hypothetical protein
MLFLKADQTSIDQLDRVSAEDVQLTALELDPEGVEKVAAFLRRAGATLRALTVEPKSDSPGLDLSALDLPALCPRLSFLRLGNARVRAGALAHPQLFAIELERCTFADRASLRLGFHEREATYNLERLQLVDCPVTPTRIELGPHSGIAELTFRLDEDYSDQPTETFRFRDCTYLRTAVIVACSAWDLRLDGTLPALERVELDAGRFGSYDLFVDVSAESSAYARSLEPVSARVRSHAYR